MPTWRTTTRRPTMTSNTQIHRTMSQTQMSMNPLLETRCWTRQWTMFSEMERTAVVNLSSSAKVFRRFEVSQEMLAFIGSVGRELH
ncbi:hypothetical protein KC19_VG322900 [Ceratodon purpureus]|uniref:Uncharacterized protein n=1 Tax=Ceratodon purpureus TaxID=3225 RepID=A0A8T0HWR5_CERPU|nr:hypothetical protein KC19_VG322900 [Ceratodon purpureus]